MEFQVNFKVNSSIYLKDPESSEIGKQIVKYSIKLIHELGLEQFTFKKLALEIGTTEATIYRYFENKHRILLYILNWYWSYMEFLLTFRLQNVSDPKEKLKIVIALLTAELPESSGLHDINKKSLSEIVISESSKVYLTKDVSEINKNQVFKPYKDLCNMISELISEFRPGFEYPKSLSTTLIEAAHQQQFFSNNLPRLTDNQNVEPQNYTQNFLEHLLFKTLA